MRFEGRFINEKGKEVIRWFEAPSEEALSAHLAKIGWRRAPIKEKRDFKSTRVYKVLLFFKYLIGSILYGLIVLGGMLLLIIPGIIWMIKFQFFSYLIIEGLGPVEALKKSAQITRGAKRELFVFGFILVGITILGVLCLFIGLFATIPTTLLAVAFVYRKLLAAQDTAQGAPAAPAG